MPAPLYLAQKVGRLLGRGEVLQRSLPPPSVELYCMEKSLGEKPGFFGSAIGAEQPTIESIVSKRGSMSLRGLYETDFYAWTVQQAKLLGHQEWEQIDLPNLIEEVESLGRQQRQELRSRLSVLLGHLLKWQYQPSGRGRSCLATIRIQRRDTLHLLKENPSLKADLDEIVEDAYANGRDLAIAETDLPDLTFPLQCLFTLDQTLDEAFYPGEPSALV